MFINTGNRTNAKFNDDLRQSTLGVWNQSVAFFNRVATVLNHFPKENSSQISERIHTATLKTADMISKAAYARSKEEYENDLKQAEEAIYTSVAALYVAYKWGYVHKGIYQQTYAEGRQLTKALVALSSSSRFSTGQLN